MRGCVALSAALLHEQHLPSLLTLRQNALLLLRLQPAASAVRAICAVAGRGIAEWVADILDGEASADDLILGLKDILATTPERPLNNEQPE